MHTNQMGLDSLPASAPTVETIKRVRAMFVGETNPAVVAIKADTDATGPCRRRSPI